MKKKIMKIVIIMIGILGLLIFLNPLVLYGSLNIGNATGIVIAAVVTFYGIRMSQMNHWLLKCFRNPAGKVGIILVIVFGLLVVIVVAAFTVSMVHAANRRSAESATIIVLGCKVDGERPSLMLKERIDAAYEYLKTYPETKAVLSGGKGSKESISEAECMYRELIALGIDRHRLYKEDQSTSTRENFKFSKQVILEEDLNPNVAVVTNEFHEYRAKKIADALGITTTAVPAKTAWWLLPTYYMRELYGILYEIVF